MHTVNIRSSWIYHFQTEMDFYKNLLRKESVHNFWSFSYWKQTRPPERPRMTNNPKEPPHSIVHPSEVFKQSHEIPMDMWPRSEFFSVVLALMQLQCSSSPSTNKEISGRRDGRYEQIPSISNYNRNPFPFGNGIFYV